MANSTGPVEARLLTTLERLLELSALDLREALKAVCQQLSEALRCEKVDTFLLDEGRSSLVALGTSNTPLGRLQMALGLDVLPLANGGRVAQVFTSGVSHLSGHVDEDPVELRSIVNELGARSQVLAVLEIDGVRRGVISAISRSPEFFTDHDRKFLEVVARWVGTLAHRAELIEQVRATEAERARRAMAEEILTVLAHDLRNHINPLLGRLHMLRLKAMANAPANAEEVNSAMRSVMRLSKMTSELLDVARLDQGLFALKLAPLDLMPLVRSACSALSTENVRVEAAGPREVLMIGDSSRLSQALENVVTNGVKHSRAGSVVRVSVKLGQKTVVVEVTDQGPGIRAELLPHLFEPFVKGSRSEGLGIGLYLAHRIAREHGGELTAHSPEQGGAQFKFELPIDANPIASSEDQGDTGTAADATKQQDDSL